MCLPLYQSLFSPSLHLLHECDVSDIFKICTIKSGSNVRFADLQIAGGGQFETRLVRDAAGDQGPGCRDAPMLCSSFLLFGISGTPDC